MTPVISIILPVYNTEQFLPACLDALVTQTLHEIEILCVNDGSTDKSADILDEYARKDNRLRVIHQMNAGPATARNRGLAEARGKYVMFCDSDDWYEPKMCERMFQTIEKNNVDFVMCDTTIIQLDRNVTMSPHYFFPEKSGCFAMDKHLALQLNVLLWNKIFRKELIDRYGVSFPDGYRNDDDAFCRSYFFVAKNLCFLDEKLYHYVQRSGSIMDEWNTHIEYKDCLSVHHIAEHLYDFLDRNSLLKNKKNWFCKFYYSLCCYLWDCMPFAYRRPMLDHFHYWVMHCKIKRWPAGRPRKFIKALEAKDYILLARALCFIPSRFALFLRVVKYSLFEKIFFGKKRKKYRRKRIKVLYEFRRLKRYLASIKEEPLAEEAVSEKITK